MTETERKRTTFIGACFADSGIRVDETLDNRVTAGIAKQLYVKWLSDHPQRVAEVSATV
jgi:hypothetical protein